MQLLHCLLEPAVLAVQTLLLLLQEGYSELAQNKDEISVRAILPFSFIITTHLPMRWRFVSFSAAHSAAPSRSSFYTFTPPAAATCCSARRSTRRFFSLLYSPVWSSWSCFSCCWR